MGNYPMLIRVSTLLLSTDTYCIQIETNITVGT